VGSGAGQRHLGQCPPEPGAQVRILLGAPIHLALDVCGQLSIGQCVV